MEFSPLPARGRNSPQGRSQQTGLGPLERSAADVFGGGFASRVAVAGSRRVLIWGAAPCGES
jgi:hypothetical protein